MNEDLAAAWTRTGGHLDDAQATIGDRPGSPLLVAYAEYRAHNELGLALDALVALAEERHAGPSCWIPLHRAAEEMALDPSDSVHGRSVASILAHVEPRE